MIRSIDHIELIVRDVDETVAFFLKLGFALLTKTGHHGGSAEIQLPGPNQPIFEIHTATGEEHLPTPSSLDAGPELGMPQSDLSRGELISRVLDSTHRQPAGEEGRPSAMVDYCETLTVRQLVDIVAYVQYVGE